MTGSDTDPRYWHGDHDRERYWRERFEQAEALLSRERERADRLAELLDEWRTIGDSAGGYGGTLHDRTDAALAGLRAERQASE